MVRHVRSHGGRRDRTDADGCEGPTAPARVPRAPVRIERRAHRLKPPQSQPPRSHHRHVEEWTHRNHPLTALRRSAIAALLLLSGQSGVVASSAIPVPVTSECLVLRHFRPPTADAAGRRPGHSARSLFRPLVRRGRPSRSTQGRSSLARSQQRRPTSSSPSPPCAARRGVNARRRWL